MQSRFIFFGALAMTLAACAPMPKQAVVTPPAEPTEEASAGGKPAQLEEPEFKAMAPIDVRVMKCSTLNSASDDDKAYASTFLLGYRSAMLHSHTLDTKQIDAVETAALADCAGKPDAVAYKVFAVAEMKARIAGEPPHRFHHRRAVEPAAVSPEGAPQPSETTPPMRYAPAQGQSAAPAPTETAPQEKPQAQAPAEKAAEQPKPTDAPASAPAAPAPAAAPSPSEGAPQK